MTPTDQPGANVAPQTIRAAIALAAVAVALRIVVFFRYRIDSDEPQHLHVAWEWSRGMVAYRDFYDNHMPFFHMLTAPWISAMGETPQIFFQARLLMIPLALCAMVLHWLLASRLYGPREAWWALLAASVTPPLVLKTTEFRNDNLWLVLVLAMFVMMVRQRWLVAGLLLGIALITSIKTAPLALAIAAAFVVTRRGSLIPLVLASLAAPLTLLGFFAFQGATADMIQWALVVNGTAPVELARKAMGLLAATALSAISIGMALRSSRDIHCFIALTVALYVAFVLAVSPLVGPRDFLITYPLILIFLMAKISVPARFVIIVLLIALTVVEGDLWDPPQTYHPRAVADALRLTDRSDRVFDQKGEIVFRHRATFMMLESVGRAMLFNGVMPDTIAVDMRAARSYVAVRDSNRIPPAARRFLNQYFVRCGAIRVAGQSASPSGSFEIAIAGPYTILDRRRAIVAGRWYEPGVYSHPLAAHVIWSGAVKNGVTLCR